MYWRIKMVSLEKRKKHKWLLLQAENTAGEGGYREQREDKHTCQV